MLETKQTKEVLMVKLVIADMDGTLLDQNNEFSDQLFEVIEKLKERDVQFAVGSGRQYYNLLKRFETIQNDMIFVAENGAMIFDHGKHVYTDEIDRDKLIQIIQEVRAVDGIYPILCGEKMAYLEDTDPVFLENTKLYYDRFEVVEDLIEATKDDTICKLAFFNEGHAESVIYPTLEKYKEEFMIPISGANWVDMMNLGVNKGQAVKVLQKKYGISKEECMAFGDYLNDYEMMKECHYSYAMANAHPKLKEICNYQAKSNRENGVVDAIIEFFKL